MNKQEIEKALRFFKGQMEGGRCHKKNCETCDAQEIAIDVLEQQLNNGWIPDRLPPEPSKEDAEPMSYLVTLNEYAIRPIQLYYIGKGRWVREYDEPCHVYENVIAWRPEPKVYKEVKDAERN